MNRTITWLLAVPFFLVGAAAFALPTIESTADGHVVRTAAMEVRLSPTGAILSIGAPGKEPVYAGAPGREAWVARAGDAWFNSGMLAPAPVASAPHGNDLLVSFVLSGEARGQRVTSKVEYRFVDHAEFTTSMTLALAEGAPVDLVSFPGTVTFAPADLQSVIFPKARGIALRPAFFAAERHIGTGFPGGFTDFVSFETPRGTLAVSELLADHASTLSIKRLDLFPEGGTYGLHSDSRLLIQPGESWNSGTILFQLDRAHDQAAQRHWELGAGARFTTLRQKLPPDVFARLAASPLLKYPDWTPERAPFKVFAKELPTLPVPSLIHFCGFMKDGHDRNYPDYLPPDPRIGTTEDFHSVTNAARALGHLTMPYTNPTWWDPESVTMQRVGMDVVVRNEAGEPLIETYGPHTGVVVSPWNVEVRQSAEATARRFQREVGPDFLFEDQVGGRSPMIDTSGAHPHRFAYAAGIEALAQRSASILPTMVEGGWDRLAAISVGFCCNGRLEWEAPHGALDDEWDPWPLQPLLANEYTATWPHNLAGEVMVHSAAEFQYNVAMGYRLAHDLNQRNEWLSICGEFQRRVLARTFGVRVNSFNDRRADAGSTTMTYDNGDLVVANWSRASEVFVRGYGIKPGGFIWLSEDGAFAAGLFAQPIGRAGDIKLDGIWIREGDAFTTYAVP